MRTHRRAQYTMVVALLLATVSGRAVSAQAITGDSARRAARAYREQHEGAILTEFATLVSLPNLASDSAGIWRNANHLLAMLAARGFTNRQLLTVPGSPPFARRC